MHPSLTTLALACGTALALSACQRPTEVVTPPPAVVVTGTPGTPGPAGPAGQAGAQGKPGDAGNPGATGTPGADTTVIVVQPPASAPAK